MAKQVVKSSDRIVKRQVVIQQLPPQFLFSRRNYIILFIGLAILAIGFMLMAGGAQPPTQFDESEVYSFRRISLSTLFVVLGFLVILYSIFQKHLPNDLKHKAAGKDSPM